MTTLDLDTFQQRWQSQDAKLDQALALNTRVLAKLERTEVRGAVGRLFLPVRWDLAMDALLVLMFGLFIGNRVAVWDAELRFLIPAVVLFGLSVLAFASSLRQLTVTESLEAVEWLRRHRIVVTKCVFLLAPVLWIPLVIVAVRALGGDLYAYMSAGFIVVNIAICGAIIPLALLAARVFGERALHYRWVRELHDALGGSRFVEARDRLAELKAFQRGD